MGCFAVHSASEQRGVAWLSNREVGLEGGFKGVIGEVGGWVKAIGGG